VQLITEVMMGWDKQAVCELILVMSYLICRAATATDYYSIVRAFDLLIAGRM